MNSTDGAARPDHHRDAVEAANRRVAAATPLPVHGARGSRSVATSSNRQPATDRRSAMPVFAEARLDVARDHARGRASDGARTPSDPTGTENDVVTTWPAPFAPDADAVALVRERRPDGAGRAALVAVIEVIDVVVVEVDGLLDEPHAEQLDAEIQIGLGVVDGRRDVMQAENSGTIRQSRLIVGPAPNICRLIQPPPGNYQTSVPPVDRLPFRLFRRHVCGRAENHAAHWSWPAT